MCFRNDKLSAPFMLFSKEPMTLQSETRHLASYIGGAECPHHTAQQAVVSSRGKRGLLKLSCARRASVEIQKPSAMNYHIELGRNGQMLWCNDPAGGVGMYAPKNPLGEGFLEIDSPGLRDALSAANARSFGRYEGRCIQPVELAGIIARELNDVLQQLAEFPSLPNPPTISVHADLAFELGGAASAMLVSEFIKRFAGSSPR